MHRVTVQGVLSVIRSVDKFGISMSHTSAGYLRINTTLVLLATARYVAFRRLNAFEFLKD